MAILSAPAVGDRASRVLLFVSLALNLFFLGALVGMRACAPAMPRDQRIEIRRVRQRGAGGGVDAEQLLRRRSGRIRPPRRLGAVDIEKLNELRASHHGIHHSDTRNEPSALRSARLARTSKVSIPDMEVPSTAAVSAFDMPS